MKPAGIIGIILIIVGIIGFAYGGLGWNTEKKDAQLGPIEIKHQERHGIDFPPILSGLCVVGGIVLVVVGSRQASAAGDRPLRRAMPKQLRLRRLNLTSSKGLLDRPSYGAFAFRTANVLLPWRSR
jgi:hypothetical protein